jgi:hypothetical protein
MAVCHYHRERPGVGICMRCRVVICAECSTRLDGINYCHACLKALGRSDKPLPKRQWSQAVLTVFLLAMAWLVFFGVGWLVQGRLAP